MLKLSHHVVAIPTSAGDLTGFMSAPTEGHGLIVFAHGSGSSRLSPRNHFVAEVLEASGFGTLLFDLLTEDEDRSVSKRFDIPLLGRRLMEAVIWVREEPGVTEDSIGLFGASTGAAAAILAAAALGPEVRAIVSRGGRPDLAHQSLSRVRAPSLFIVGQNDPEVIEVNQKAIDQLPLATERRLEVIPGASHLFEEPGTLERAAELARGWFEKYAVAA